MEELLRFVIRLLDGEEMSFLCREFGISRKTGYKIFDRYKECGLHALDDRSRRPFRYGNQLPMQVEAAILQLNRDKPHWGARKLLLRKFSSEGRVPAVSISPSKRKPPDPPRQTFFSSRPDSRSSSRSLTAKGPTKRSP